MIANADDYALVKQLVNDPISQSLDKAVSDSIRSVVEGVQTLQEQAGGPYHDVSQTKLAELLKRDQSAVSRNVKKAIEQGYLRNEDSYPGQGREARLRLGDRKLPSGSVLPDLEVLFGTPPAGD